MNPLQEKLLSLYPFDNEGLTHALSHFHEGIFPKKSFLLQEGEVSDKIFYIQSGLIREFSVFNDHENPGNSSTTGIISEGKFVYSVESYLTDQPSMFFIQALENTHAYFIKKSNINHLVNSLEGASNAFSKIHESYLLEYDKRLQLLRFNAHYKNYNQQYGSGSGTHCD